MSALIQFLESHQWKDEELVHVFYPVMLVFQIPLLNEPIKSATKTLASNI